MKRILTTLFVLASTSVSGIAAASHYDDRYDYRYDDRYYEDRYNDDYYYDDRYQDDWYYDSRYEDDDYYDDRYNDDWYGDRYRSSSYSYKYGHSSKLRPINRTKTIEIRRDFRPETITVKAGTTVTWVNRDYMPHTVRSDKRGLFSSRKFYEGQRYSVTFLYPGTFDYHCSLHPGMTGTVRVVR